MYITVNGIVGISLGVEYVDDEYFDYLVFDLFLIRIMLIKERDATD